MFAQLAEELRKDGELEEAIGVARAGLERHPAYASARLTLGRALLDSGDPAAARLELEAAVQGAPENIRASRLLGEALEQLGDLGSALDRYARTLQMAPGDEHVTARIRDLQSRLGAPGKGAGGGPEATDPRNAFGEDEEEDEEDLPPTIRIRMPGDSLRAGRAPLPPLPGPQAAGEMTQPSQAESGAPVSPGTAAPPDPAPAAPEPTGEGRVPDAPAIEPRGIDAAAVGTPSVETAAVEETAIEEPAVEGAPEGQPAEPKEPTHSGEPEAKPVDSGAEPGGDGPDGGPAGKAAGAVEDRGAAEAVAGPDSPALSSATLAELYFEQGLLERAVEVYRQVLDEEPTNKGARERLAQIEMLVRDGAADLSVPAENGDDPAARRRALERTIARLEALLEVVRRR